MEALESYRKAILAVITPPPMGSYLHKEVKETLLVDQAQDQYLVVRTGWHNGKNYYSIIQHLSMVDGQVWIHVNNTEHEVEAELEEEGVRPEDIVSAYLAPEDRTATPSTF